MHKSPVFALPFVAVDKFNLIYDVYELYKNINNNNNKTFTSCK